MRAILVATSAVLLMIAIGVGVESQVQAPSHGPVLVGRPQGSVGGDSGPGQMAGGSRTASRGQNRQPSRC